MPDLKFPGNNKKKHCSSPCTYLYNLAAALWLRIAEVDVNVKYLSHIDQLVKFSNSIRELAAVQRC